MWIGLKNLETKWNLLFVQAWYHFITQAGQNTFILSNFHSRKFLSNFHFNHGYSYGKLWLKYPKFAINLMDNWKKILLGNWFGRVYTRAYCARITQSLYFAMVKMQLNSFCVFTNHDDVHGTTKTNDAIILIRFLPNINLIQFKTLHLCLWGYF